MGKIIGLRSVQPYLVGTGIACTTTSGSDTVGSSAAFGSVALGMPLKGTGIPGGAVVGQIVSTSSVRMMDSVDYANGLGIDDEKTKKVRATATGSPTLQFGYGNTAILADGDIVGFQFPIIVPQEHGGKARITRINLISHAAHWQGALTLWLFRNNNFTEANDNAAMSFSVDDVRQNLFDIVPFVATTAFVVSLAHGSGRPYIRSIVPPTDIPVSQGAFYGMLVCQASFTPGAGANDRDIVIKFTFEEEV